MVHRNSLRVRLALACLVLVAPSPALPRPIAETVEVFVSNDQQIIGDDSAADAVHVEVYHLDGLQRLSTTLSQRLPTDAAAAQRIALQRIGHLDQGDRDTLRSAAVGLTKALQYGLDRYPAIVINHAAVVYGTTDIDLALDRYHAWQGDAP